ncbi:MAG: hypothetical protein CM15mP102_10990 [Flavobacteriales bacterium]|nr:MAG: hypothetical protein CM15mP102_10990 [Flavobacteriales bacterium]
MLNQCFCDFPDIIVSHTKFKRLNNWLKEKGILVEKVDFSNVSKMSGLFRCSTLPFTESHELFFFKNFNDFSRKISSK